MALSTAVVSACLARFVNERLGGGAGNQTSSDDISLFSHNLFHMRQDEMRVHSGGDRYRHANMLIAVCRLYLQQVFLDALSQIAQFGLVICCFPVVCRLSLVVAVSCKGLSMAMAIAVV